MTHEEIRVERRQPTETPLSSAATEEGPVDSKKEIKVPVREEEVSITKQPFIKEVIVKKKPVTETKTVIDTITTEKVNVGEETRRSVSPRTEEGQED
jgi:uncharacterized protein (TIGR02271 family)